MKKILTLILILFLFSGLTLDKFYEEQVPEVPEVPMTPSDEIDHTLNGVIQCDKVTDRWWRREESRERWLGDDPTLKYGTYSNLVRITHYGLEGSSFRTPEDYEARLENLFTEIESREPVSLAGRPGTLIRLRYENPEFIEHHGGFVSHEFGYEEFIIVPLAKGFLVFNFTLHHHSPMPMNRYTKKDAIGIWEKELAEKLETWKKFLAGCSIPN